MKITIIFLSLITAFCLSGCENASNQPSGTGALRVDTGATIPADSNKSTLVNGSTADIKTDASDIGVKEKGSNSSDANSVDKSNSNASSVKNRSTNLRTDSSGNTGSPTGASSNGTGYGRSGASNSSVPTPNGPAPFEDYPEKSESIGALP